MLVFLMQESLRERAFGSEQFCSYEKVKEDLFSRCCEDCSQAQALPPRHTFLSPIQFTLAQRDNSLVCSHPGLQHKSSLLVHVVTASQVSWMFFSEFPINVVHTKKDPGMPAFPPKPSFLQRVEPEKDSGGDKIILWSRETVTLRSRIGGFNSSLA